MAVFTRTLTALTVLYCSLSGNIVRASDRKRQINARLFTSDVVSNRFEGVLDEQTVQEPMHSSVTIDSEVNRNWYYSDETPYHQKQKVHLKNRSDALPDKKEFADYDDYDDCIERYAKGRLGLVVCKNRRGRPSSSEQLNGMMGMKMKGMKKKALANSSKLAHKSSQSKGKGRATLTPVAPSTLEPIGFPTVSPAVPLTLSPSVVPGPSTPTTTPSPSLLAPSSFTTSQPTVTAPSLPPGSTNAPSFASGATGAPSFPPGATAHPTPLLTSTPSMAQSSAVSNSTTAPSTVMGTSMPSAPVPPTLGPSTQLETGAPTQFVSSDSPSIAPSPGIDMAQPAVSSTLVPTTFVETAQPAVNKTLLPTTAVETARPDVSPTSKPTLVSTSSPSKAQATAVPSVAPTIDTTTLQPFVHPITTAPSRGATSGFIRRATPFSATYLLTSDSYTEQQFSTAQRITQQFLDDYVSMQFADKKKTGIDKLTSKVLEVNAGSPPDAAFGLEIKFNESSTFVPSNQEVDVLIESAFMDPAVQELITALQNLPLDNPFSGVVAVEYMPRYDLDNKYGGKNSTRDETTPPVIVDDPSSDDVYTLYEEANLKITPFSISYDIFGGDPCLVDTDEAAKVTLSFLDEYLRTLFNSVTPGSYSYLAGFGVGDMTKMNQIGFLTGVDIAEGSPFAPLQDELDLAVEAAFMLPNVETLISMLHSLPDDNPYSMTTSIAFESVPSINATSTSLSAIALSGLVVLTLCTLLCAVGMMIVQRKRVRFARKKRRILSDNESIHGDLIEIISDGTPSVGSSFENEEEEETVIIFRKECMLRKGKRGVVDPLLHSPFNYTEPMVTGVGD